MRDSDTDLVKTLATQLNFGGFYGEELCTRAGVEKALPISEAGDEEFRALYDAVDRLVSDLRGGRFDPRVYYEDGRRVDVSPFPLAERERLESEAFDSFLAAIDDYFTNVEYDDGENESGGEPARPDFESEIEKRKRIIQQQESAIEGFDEEASALREGAELLYANYDLVDEILSTVRAAREEDVSWDAIAERFAEGRERGIDAAEAVVDVDGSDGTVTVAPDEHELELMVAEGVEKNADRLYEEAKRIEEKKAGALDAIENTRRELADLKRRREEWEAGDDDEQEDDEEESREVDWLARRNVPVRQSEDWYDRFRWFRTSDGFLVIGGRNAEQNEEIVKKYLSRADRFFHAQAHGGPATVLKATEPSEPARDIDIPERSRREAAQFAVSYSSVWKDGRFAGDVYEVAHDQVTKTPESGEYLEKGGFAIRGDRTYYDDTEVGVAVGITCEPETRVIGGPPDPIHERAETSIEVEPGRYAQNDMGKMLYREFKDRFVDDTFVRKVASPDRIQEFLPPGGSRNVD
jgi:predicted ribosome quality control (RQC) complex YloA/Tae2 family protein